jgi:hypothetical protein
MAKNAWRATGVIQRPLDAPDWDDTGRRRFLEQMSSRYSGGANAGRPLLLEEGMTWQSDTISLRSAEYVAARELTTKVVALAFHMSPQIMGLEGAPYASITEYNRQLYTNVLAPRLDFLEQGFEKQLVPELHATEENVYCEFSLEAKLRGSFQEQAQIAQIALGGKAWMTVPEWRAIMNMGPLSEEEQAELNPEPVPDSPGPDPSPIQDQPQPSDDRLSAPRKAAPRGLETRRDEIAKQLDGVLTKMFSRQRQNAKSKGLSNRTRWDRELSQDLRPIMELAVTAEATRKATQLGGDYDPKYHRHYLDEAAKESAKGVNNKVDEALERHKDNLDEAFDVALPALGAKFALGQATRLFSFARQEAAKQNGGGQKTWIVTSSNSRHPEMDGETVPVYEMFSNGLEYPGAGSPDESAGCQCLLDVSGGKSASQELIGKEDAVNISINPVINVPEVKFPEFPPFPEYPKQEPPNITVNVPEPTLPDIHMDIPEPKKLKRVIHRDEKGRFSHMTEEIDDGA